MAPNIERDLINMNENRAFDRVNVGDKHVTVLYQGDANGKTLGQVIDISKGGMLVLTYETPRVGDYILATINVEDLGQVIWAGGRVVRASSYGIGIQFTHVDHRGIEAILETHRSRA